jgi:uncharacterized protein (TIGR03435 family)
MTRATSISVPLLLLLVLTGALASSQTFDVASVKQITDPATLQAIKSGDITYKGGTVTMNGVSLGYAVQWAFDIQNYQLDGPDWINWKPANDQPRYIIVAKTGPDVPKAAARLMVQKLLEERFGLKAHWEDRMKTGFTLKDDPKGVKIERIEPTVQNPLMSYDRKEGRVKFTNMTIQELCGDIALSIREPVVDGTSISNSVMFNATAIVRYENSDEMVNALFAGLKHDMGIVAVREKVPVKTVVVDQINEHPTEN